MGSLPPPAPPSLLALALLLLVGCAGPSAGATTTHPLARKPAPDVVLKLDKGGELRPGDAKGKVLLVDFWATWCGPCKASFPRIDALYQRLHAKGLEVVAVNEDPEEDRGKVPAFVAETKATFTIAFDQDGKAAEAFGVQSMPSSFLIDRKGVVRYAHAGYHAEDAKQVEAELEELLGE